MATLSRSAFNCSLVDMLDRLERRGRFGGTALQWSLHMGYDGPYLRQSSMVRVAGEVVCRQTHITYNSIYQVPVLWFHFFDRDGRPLCTDRVMDIVTRGVPLPPPFVPCGEGANVTESTVPRIDVCRSDDVVSGEASETTGDEEADSEDVSLVVDALCLERPAATFLEAPDENSTVVRRHSAASTYSGISIHTIGNPPCPMRPVLAAAVAPNEHPYLGVLFYHIHPCKTAELMLELKDSPNYVISWLSLYGALIGLSLPADIFVPNS